MIYVEPLPEPINKGVVVEPNLSKRIRQKEVMALARRNAAELLNRNTDIKEVSEYHEPRQKSATNILKRRTDSWNETKKVFNPLPLQFMPMLRSASK